MREYFVKKFLNNCLNLGDDQTRHNSYMYHFDTRKLFLSDSSDVLSYVSEQIWHKIKHLDPEVLFTEGVAGYPLIFSIKEIAFRDGYNLSCLFIRDSRKEYGLKKLIEGDDPANLINKRAIFIDDLLNTGKTFEKSKEILIKEDYNLKIVGMGVVIDFWNVNGSRKYNAKKFPVFSVFTRHELGLTRQDHGLKEIVKKLNWRTNEFHNGKDILKWKGCPVLHDNMIYIGSDNGHHYCFDKDNGDLKWINKSAKPQPKGDVSVTQFFENKCYWSSYDGTVKCCDKNTGETIWTVKTDLNLHSSPTLDSKNNRLFIGTEWNKYPINQGGFGEGDVVCLRMNDGKELWRFKTNGMIPCCVAYSSVNNTVITGSNDFHMYVLDADTGELIKKIPTKGEVKGKVSLSLDEKRAIGVSIQGYAYCIDTKSGEILWTKRIGFESLHCYPLIYKNFVTITNSKGGVSCIDINTGETVWVALCRDELGWGVIELNEELLLGITRTGQILTFNKFSGKKMSSDYLKNVVNEDLIILQPPCFDGENLYIVSNNTGLFSFKINV